MAYLSSLPSVNVSCTRVIEFWLGPSNRGAWHACLSEASLSSYFLNLDARSNAIDTLSNASRPREHTSQLIIVGCAIIGTAVCCYAGLFLKMRIPSLSVNEYKDTLWSRSGQATELLVAFPRVRMRVVLLSALALCAGVFAQSSTVVDQYVASESPIAKAGVLANIGSSGSRSSGAKSGVVIASPSTSNPNYLYTWIRDSALVFKCLIDQYTRGEDTSLRTLIDQYLGAQATLQQVSNPSGTVSTGGIGEPKFNIDETAFTGGWGRPQRDGPALRSIALITYANWLIGQSNSTYVVQKVWPVVQLDLNYVANHWNLTGFDLWEEVDSASFFTSAVQHRALRQGVALAQSIGQTGPVSLWSSQADNILCFLQSYWNPASGYVTSNTGGGRSGKDVNSVLASIHTFDPAAGCNSGTFQPCSDKALSNLKLYVDSFRSIYSINSGIAANKGVATGRYPEDVYYNGNPWYLATAAVAEQLYDALIVWKAQGSLTVTSTSLAFFRQFLSSVTAGTYSSSTGTYTTIINAVQGFADDFLAMNAKYTPGDGSLAEQYDKSTGAPTSAVHLTWSYASALTAFAARKGTKPASWGAQGLQVPSGNCQNPGPLVSATFNEYATTVWGENIYLTGSLDQLANWSPDNAIPLSSAAYPTWSVTVNVPANTAFEFKFIRKNNGAVTWESDPNRQATSPASGSFTINSSWR
ncbi:putative starch binding domain containing protein [Lyophyllum shimeji]|uniref:glucan 1,4-alpha-glucosidase n=1 Tax=Lyophyllum shimeji TaxID=47721 RepID=A0A9P3PNN0_LYOSH|nr:putative starch binding domain containing protein [Lyophyllum shimeji]